MTHEFLGERRAALREAFFAKRDQELLEKFRAETEAQEARAGLAAASGISDDEVLDAFVEMELGADTVAAISLVPLVAVAWADEKMASTERTALLSACENMGIQAGTPAMELVTAWMNEAPPAELVETWASYIQALCESMSGEKAAALKQQIMGRAQDVAEAAGGILGLTSKVSADEKRVIDQLADAFPA